MKFVTAVIKPLKLDEIRCALDKLNVTGLTVSDVKGFGRQKGTTGTKQGQFGGERPVTTRPLP